MKNRFYKAIIWTNCQKGVKSYVWWNLHKKKKLTQKLDRYNPAAQKSFYKNKNMFLSRYSIRKYQALGLVPLKKK